MVASQKNGRKLHFFFPETTTFKLHQFSVLREMCQVSQFQSQKKKIPHFLCIRLHISYVHMCVKCVKHSFKAKKKKRRRLQIFDHILSRVMNSPISLCLVLVLSLQVLGPVAPFAGVRAHRPAAVKKQVGGATETKRAGAARKQRGRLLRLKDNYESASTSQCCVVSGSGRAAPSQQASGGPRGQRPPVSGVGGSDNGPHHRPSVMCLHTSDGGSGGEREWRRLRRPRLL